MGEHLYISGDYFSVCSVCSPFLVTWTVAKNSNWGLGFYVLYSISITISLLLQYCKKCLKQSEGIHAIDVICCFKIISMFTLECDRYIISILIIPFGTEGVYLKTWRTLSHILH